MQQKASAQRRSAVENFRELFNSNDSHPPIIQTAPPKRFNQTNISSYYLYPYYQTYINRKTSFSLKRCPYYYQNFLSKELSNAGFFYNEFPEEVCCFSCGFKVHKWLNINIPCILLHLKFMKRCNYLNSDEAKKLIAINMSNQIDGLELLLTPETPRPSRDMSNPVNPIYDSFYNRQKVLKAFNYMWKTSNKRLNDMAKAGFFYSQDKDKFSLYCFHCGNGMGGWIYADDAAKEHAYFYPDCGWIAYSNSLEYQASLKDIKQLNKPSKIKLIKSEFANISDRTATFLLQWPDTAQRTFSMRLARAGLFLLGTRYRPVLRMLYDVKGF